MLLTNERINILLFEEVNFFVDVTCGHVLSPNINEPILTMVDPSSIAI